MSVIRMGNIIESRNSKLVKKGNNNRTIVRMKEIINNPIRKDNPKKVVRVGMNKEDTWNFFYEMGWIDGNHFDSRDYSNINGAWFNEPCYIIGSGPSLKDFIDKFGWDWLDGKNTIGINHVIEDYDRFKWFFFLDKRFLDRTTYDIKNFKGRIFAQNNTGFKQDERTVLFKCSTVKMGNTIQQGLFSPNFSGLAALNLAIITGANPIYLLGFGNVKGTSEKCYHYKDNYTGEVKEKYRFNKYKRVMGYFREFKSYRERIYHVTEGNDLKIFRRLNMKSFKAMHKEVKKIEVKGRLPEIIHFSFTNNIDKMGDVSRYIINKCYGKHKLVDVNSQSLPLADLYIMEHFLSTDKFVNFFPYKNKAIDLVHTVNCIPKKGFKKIVALTDSWKKYLEKHLVNNIDVIPACIDIEKYKNISPDYDKKIFGRITRWSQGKIHPEWNRIVKELLEEEKDSSCLIYCENPGCNNRPILNHEKMLYNKEVSINMDKGDYLKNMSIYVHANGYFKETFSHAVVEAMATGLPVIFLSEGTGVIEEVTGKAGYRCTSIEEVKKAIKLFLNDKDLRIEYGKRSKEQSKKYNYLGTVNKWNEVIKECLK